LLAEYRGLRSLKAKEDFEAVMAYGQAEGAIEVKRPRSDPQGLIERVELLDVTKLAMILGEIPYAKRVEVARQTLAARFLDYPDLLDILSCWEMIKKVRSTGPDDAANWASACDVIDYCRAQVALGATETPVRDASARLFKDSKRIEFLVSRLDVLLGPPLRMMPGRKQRYYRSWASTASSSLCASQAISWFAGSVACSHWIVPTAHCPRRRCWALSLCPAKC
jgi:hypothetical protein